MSTTGGPSKPGASKPTTSPLEFLQNTEVAETRGWTSFRRVQPASKGVSGTSVAKKRAKAGGRNLKTMDTGKGNEKATAGATSDLDESEHGAKEPAPAHAREQAACDGPVPIRTTRSARAHREEYTRSKEVMIFFLRKSGRPWGNIAEIYNRHWYPNQGIVVSSNALRKRHYNLTRCGEAELADEHYHWMQLWDGSKLTQPEE